MVKVESIYHYMIRLIIWLFPKYGKEIFMEHFGFSVSCITAAGQGAPWAAWVFQFSLSWLGLVCAPFRCVILKIYFPFWFLPSHLHFWLLASPFYLSIVIFASPLGCAGSVTSVVTDWELSQSWACGFSALSNLRRLLCTAFLTFPSHHGSGMGRAWADRCLHCRAAGGGGSAHPQPGARQVLGMMHSTFLYLAFNWNPGHTDLPWASMWK